MNGKQLLTFGALGSFAASALHFVCLFTGEATARFFSAPPIILKLVREGSWLMIPIVLLIMAILGLFGTYAWSGAGRMRRLPLLRTGLIVIGTVYLLRGLLLVPQLLYLTKHPGAYGLQILVFSAVSLFFGIAYLTGCGLRWKEF